MSDGSDNIVYFEREEIRQAKKNQAVDHFDELNGMRQMMAATNKEKTKIDVGAYAPQLRAETKPTKLRSRKTQMTENEDGMPEDGAELVTETDPASLGELEKKMS